MSKQVFSCAEKQKKRSKTDYDLKDGSVKATEHDFAKRYEPL
jgi:hypothetical protein